MRAALGLPQLCGLMAVPAEVKLMILGSLSVQCILNVSCTCRELRSLSSDSTLWQHLVFRDFGTRAKEQSRSWKMTYVQLYEQKKNQERLRMQVIVPPLELFPPYHGLGSQPFRGNTFPPGIIGGQSDLFPNLPFMPGGINPTHGIRPGPGLPRPRFDPFGPLPDINQMPGPSRRGRRSDPSRNFPPGFL
ncbi:F-box only protein 7 [Desmophyllum pertusum]|uniref:F-box only protein 7 n=1 Tax=Desmophyllum pertusum TaxID=174260 RepID=A0A9W9Z782_9CNID|nr:F-box only protein 7 [Desmophyllum pertusum]